MAQPTWIYELQTSGIHCLTWDKHSGLPSDLHTFTQTRMKARAHEENDLACNLCIFLDMEYLET